ncbi:MAG: hypothetical protein AMXMBFR4_04080 [Candidatus Hydrogenedentota bacterium]
MLSTLGTEAAEGVSSARVKGPSATLAKQNEINSLCIIGHIPPNTIITNLLPPVNPDPTRATPPTVSTYPNTLPT